MSDKSTRNPLEVLRATVQRIENSGEQTAALADLKRLLLERICELESVANIIRSRPCGFKSAPTD